MIQAWFAKRAAQMWAVLAGIAAAALMVLGFYRNAKRSGALDAEKEHAEAEIKRVDSEAVRKVEIAHAQTQREIETVKGAKDETDKVNRLSDDAVTSELHDKWSRD